MKTLKTLSSVFILLCVIVFDGATQNIQVTASRHDILYSSVRRHKIFGHDQNSYYVIKFTGTQYLLEKLDHDLNSVIEEPIKLFKGLRTYELESVVDFYDDIYVFVSLSRLNNITLYYQKISKGNLLPITELIEITTIKNIKGAWADFHLALSKHETKLMIACRIKLAWSGAQFNEYYVYGRGMEMIWKRNDSFQFQGQGPRDNYYLVDETGNISILSLLKRESVISLFRDIRNLYSIYRYTNNGKDFNEYPVTLGERYIRGIKIVSTDNGELLCAGLFSESYKTGVRGTFFFRVDPLTGRMTELNLNAFDEAVRAELAGLKEPMIKEEELINYVITDMVFRKNGKMILIAEQVFHQSYNTLNNLIVTCYNVNGQVEWTRIIAKKQNFRYTPVETTGIELNDLRGYIRETGYMNPGIESFYSYALMAPVDKSGIVIFYNDNIKNLHSEKEKKAFSQPKKSYLLAIAVDEFGNISKTPLIPWKKKMLFPEPLRFYDTLSDTIIIPAFRNRNVNFYKIQADAIP
jgi:hypothetical protein